MKTARDTRGWLDRQENFFVYCGLPVTEEQKRMTREVQQTMETIYGEIIQGGPEGW